MTSRKRGHTNLSASLGSFLSTHAAKGRFPLRSPGMGKQHEASFAAALKPADQPNGESRQARRRRELLADKADFYGKRRES